MNSLQMPMVSSFSREYNSLAPRPKNSRLCLDRLNQVFGVSPPDWETALPAVLDDFVALLGDLACIMRDSVLPSGRTGAEFLKFENVEQGLARGCYRVPAPTIFGKSTIDCIEPLPPNRGAPIRPRPIEL